MSEDASEAIIEPESELEADARVAIPTAFAVTVNAPPPPHIVGLTELPAGYLVAIDPQPQPEIVTLTDVAVGPPGPPGPPGEPADPLPPQVDTYQTPGSFTWTKPANAVSHDIIVCGSGGGGGSGMRGAAGTVRCGGGGGSGGVRNAWLGIPSGELADTLTGTILAGGAGGASSAADDTPGSAGGIVSTSYNNIGEYLGRNGMGGAGGSAVNGPGGGGGIGTNSGGAASTAGGAGTYGGYTNYLNAFGAASGGGVTSANVGSNGGVGYVRAEFAGSTLVGGTGGAVGGPGRTNTYTYPDVPLQPGTGGSGGGGGSAGAGGAGGDGVLGGGGAGGGASVNGFPSGAGGRGGDGYVQVITYFGIGPQGADSTVPGPPGDKGDKGDPGTPGTKGDKGDKGDQGDPGPSFTLTTGDTATIDLTGTGLSGDPLTADVKSGAVLTAVGDTATVDLTNTAGTVTADVKPNSVGILANDTATIDFTGVGTVASPLTASVIPGSVGSQVPIVDEGASVADWTFTAGSVVSVNVADSSVGGRVLRCSGHVPGYRKANVPFDPTALYRIKFRVRQTTDAAAAAPAGNFYAGLTGIAADGVTLVNRDGNNTMGVQHNVACAGVKLLAANGWVEYVGYVRGVAAAGSGASSPSPTAPGVMHQNTRYIRPQFQINYNAPDGVAEIDYVSLEIVPGDALIAVGDTATVDLTNTAGTVTADVKPNSVGILTQDTATIGFTGTGTAASILKADLKPGAMLTAVGDTATVDLTNTAGTVTADVKPGAVLTAVGDTATVGLVNTAGTVTANVKSGPVLTGVTSGTEVALTNTTGTVSAALTGTINTAPTTPTSIATKQYVDSRFKTGTSTLTTDGSGYITVTHGAGFTPSAVMAIGQSPISTSNMPFNVMVDTITATTFRTRWADNSGSAIASVSITFRWICFA